MEVVTSASDAYKLLSQQLSKIRFSCLTILVVSITASYVCLPLWSANWHTARDLVLLSNYIPIADQRSTSIDFQNDLSKIDDWLFSRPCSSKTLFPVQLIEYDTHFRISCMHVASDSMLTRSASEKVGDLLNKIKQHRASYRVSYAKIDRHDLDLFNYWYKFDNKSVHTPICRNDVTNDTSVCCFARGEITCSQQNLIADIQNIENSPEKPKFFMRGNISYLVTNYSVSDDVMRNKLPHIIQQPALFSINIEDAIYQELVGKLPKIDDPRIPVIGISVTNYQYLFMFPILLAFILWYISYEARSAAKYSIAYPVEPSVVPQPQSLVASRGCS